MKPYVAISQMLLGAFLLVAANAQAQGGESRDGFEWLKAMIVAEHQTDYSGVFVYQHENNVDTSRITHVIEGDGEYERLESLDGPRREIVRHDGHVWGHHDSGRVQVDSQQGMDKFSSLLPEQLSALSTNYQAKLLGMERVAGYNAQVILFQPNDNWRYSHKIWVHTDSGLLLKAAVLGAKNKLIEQYTFSQLQIGGKIDRSWVKPSASTGLNGSDLHQQMEAAKTEIPVNSGWVVDVLPPGFKKTREIQRLMHGNHEPVTQIVFSDGLSAISIFIELDDGDEDDMESLSSWGAMSLYHKVVGKHLFTVVGEVPAYTVMRTLDSIRHSGK